LHWVEDLEPVFARLARALRPHGRLVFSVEHPALTGYQRSIEQYFQLLRRHGFDVGDLREATPCAEHISDAAELRRPQRVPVMLLLAARKASPASPPQISRKP
jgi:hypothetical protein